MGLHLLLICVPIMIEILLSSFHPLCESKWETKNYSIDIVHIEYISVMKLSYTKWGSFVIVHIGPVCIMELSYTQWGQTRAAICVIIKINAIQ